jgi:hypothetical protein
MPDVGSLVPRIDRWDASREIPAAAFADIRVRMVLEGCKWDPQIGDTAILAPFPLIIPKEDADHLADLAERLAAEAFDAEQALLDRPGCLKILGLPQAIRRALSHPAPPSPVAARVIRFDFHPAAEGWRISEANADVPGGYTESSLFPRLLSVAWRS